MNAQKILFDMILEYLKGKEKFSPLEKDILEISQLYTERPVNRTEATRKILEVDSNCPDVAAIIRTAPGTQIVPFDCLSDDDILGGEIIHVTSLHI